MPTISMFYGILIAIMFEDNDRHNLPHIHIRYSGEKPPSQSMTDVFWLEVFRQSS